MGIMSDFLRWEAKVKKTIPKVLITDVKQVVEEDFVEVADSAVYGTYSPSLYVRRYSGGGIQDVGQIESKLDGDLTLVMEDVAPANSNDPQGKNAIEWVESDEGIPGGRPFYAPLEAVATPHAHEALVAGLHKAGL